MSKISVAYTVAACSIALSIAVVSYVPPVDSNPDNQLVTVGQVADALYTPCVSEDSDNCYWNAAISGNGIGTSFVVIDGVYFDNVQVSTPND